MMLDPLPGQTKQQLMDQERTAATARMRQRFQPTAPQTPQLGQQPFSLPQLPTPSAPQAPATPAAPAGPNPNVLIGQQITDPTPYNNAVAKGQGFLGTIPGNANFLAGSSPMFRGMNMGRLNNQVAQLGSGLQNQAGLEFSRKAGTEAPRMLLAQLAGLRGLENDTLGLENTILQNQVRGSITPLQTIMRLLGAVGGFF